MRFLSRYGSMECSVEYLFSICFLVISNKIIDQFLSFPMLSHTFAV
jgi:hypothetical protein